MGGIIVRLALAFIFAQSALHALLDIARHSTVVEHYRLLPLALVPLVARSLPILMLMISAALLVSYSAQWAAVFGALLVIIFFVAIVVNLARGRDRIECGCGGPPGQWLSRGLATRNATLVGLLLGAAFAPSSGPIDAAVVVGVLGGAGTLVGFYFAANALLNNRNVLRAAGE
jgi:Methylamine utilisation protein MauE